MPTNETDPNATPQGGEPEPKKETTPVGVPLAQVEQLVSTFRETMETFKASQPSPPTADPSKAIEEARARYDDVRKKANDLAATGDYAGSMEAMWQFIQSNAQASRPSTQDDPNVASLRSTARRIVAADNKETFEKYGNEINAEIKNLPLDKQISPEGWEDAIRTVRGRHADEIITEQTRIGIEKALAERDGLTHDDGFIPPIAGGSRGRRGNDNDVSVMAARLSPEEVGVAASFGLSRETYAKQKKEIGGRELRIDILPPVDRVEPGRF